MPDSAGPIAAVDQQERLKRLIDAGVGLHAELSLEALLRRLVETAVSLTGAQYGALGVLDRTGDALEQFLTVGIDDGTRAAIGEPPRGRGILGLLIRETKPLRLRDLSEHPRSVGFPPGHPPMRTFLGVPILMRGIQYGSFYLTEKDGGEFTEEDEDLVVLLASHAAVAIENARLYEAARRWSRQLTGLAEFGDALASELDAGRLLELIVTHLAELVEARLAYVLLPAADGSLRVEAATGEQAELLLGTHHPLQGSKAGRVFCRRLPERVDSVIDDPELDLAQTRLVGTSAGIWMPLVAQDRAVGVLAVCDKRGRDPRFTDEDVRIAEMVAARAAAAIDTSQRVTRETVRAILDAQEAERRRLARELHDEAGQALSSIILGLAPLEATAGEAAVRPLRELVSGALDDVRRLAVDLRPAVLDDFGLVPALERLVDDLRRRTPLEAALVADFEHRRLPPEVETTLYRVVQEALSNVVRHARARSIVVALRQSDAQLTVVVEDDGDGFSPADVGVDRLGLVGMRERVALIHGTCEIASGDGGTRVVVSVPALAAGG